MSTLKTMSDDDLTNDQSIWFDFIDQAKYDRNVTRWLKALRSGKYKQGDNYLHQAAGIHSDGQVFPAEYCCLGVACQLSRMKSDASQGSDIALVHYGKTQVSSLPPMEFAKWLGFDPLSARLPHGFTNYTAVLGAYPLPEEVSVHLGNEDTVETTIEGKNHQEGDEPMPFILSRYCSLAGLNDDGMHFGDIADLIEEFGIRMRWNTTY